MLEGAEEEGAKGAREEGAGLLWELSAYGAGAIPVRGCCLRMVKPVVDLREVSEGVRGK